jgi:hypothetical protein
LLADPVESAQKVLRHSVWLALATMTNVAGRAAVQRNLQSQAAVKLAAEVARLTVVRHPILRVVLRASGRLCCNRHIDVYVDLIQLGMRLKIPMQQTQIRGGSDAVLAREGPTMGPSLGSRRPMMGPRLAPHGPMMGPSSGPQWAHDVYGPMNRCDDCRRSSASDRAV